mgnify:CR=1 FL=1
MRILLAGLGSLFSTFVFAHSGHGETSAMHHSMFSPLNGLEPLVALAAFAIFVLVAWKRS